MFTGIIETIGVIHSIEKDRTNIHFTIQSSISPQLKIDQSVAHNGVCLTVVEIMGDRYKVTAIQETLDRTNLKYLQIGDLVNIERAMQYNARLDGHLVQGHVDTTALCTSVRDMEGSWYYSFEYPAEKGFILVDKGSVCVNGVSLTVVSPSVNSFSVAIIPYTYTHTNFKDIRANSVVNIEFDIIGKYIARHIELYR